ncbi:MAG: methylated-DNA--[protein]-cysteine S-methyltransferase [Chitinophagales bacterium]|nr:methylated-DNA--[protein]-cysteine S-methyltransferase [Chitinophagales bacterium]
MNVRQKLDFWQLTKALSIFYNYHGSLFLTEMIEEQLQLPLDQVKNELYNYFGDDATTIIQYLSPHYIQQNVASYRKIYNPNDDANSNIVIEILTDDELKSEDFTIDYSFADTFLGPIILASTTKGICYIAFADESQSGALEKLQNKFPKIKTVEQTDSFQSVALEFFNKRGIDYPKVHLHLKATDFQISVWKKLINIPSGQLLTYSAIAGNNKDSHALGNAVGSNPIAYIIPCHRAVKATGEYGEYHWEPDRKAALIVLERVEFLK